MFEVTESHRKEILQRIVERTIIELEQKKFDVLDLPKIGEFALDTISTATDHTELLVYLEEFVEKWPQFTSIRDIEKAEIEQSSERDVAEQVLQLSKEGKIEEAVALAKTITEKGRE